MKKKVLLVGDASSYFIKSIYKNLNAVDKYQLGVFNINPKNSSAVSDKEHINNDKISAAESKKNIVKIANLAASIKIPVVKKLLYKIYLLYNFWKFYKKAAKFDIINFHHLDDNARKYASFSVKYLSQKQQIISFWGSDYYKRKTNEDDFLVKLLERVNTITFTNEKSKENFEKTFNWKQSNLYTIQFGLEQLDLIHNYADSKEQIKKYLNIDLSKKIITIGYNASENQQHELVVNELKKLAEDELLTQNLHLLVPLTYGSPVAYKQELVRLYEQLPFSKTLFTNYLPDETITQLRIVSDIMIQLQKTDQFSGSMQEYFYTENVVITGNWLPYETFKSAGVYFEEISAVNELSSKLIEVINGYSGLKPQTASNPKIIHNLSSWNSTIHKWDELYEL